MNALVVDGMNHNVIMPIVLNATIARDVIAIMLTTTMTYVLTKYYNA